MNEEKTFFWIVDCQHDFMDSDGKLYVDGAEDIKENLKLLKNFIVDESLTAVYTTDWHYIDSEELSDNPDFISTFPEHCMVNTIGAEIIDEIRPDNFGLTIGWEGVHKINKLSYPMDILLRKDKFDFIEGNQNSNHLLDVLEEQFDNVVVVGVAGNVCVNQAVMGLKDRFNVTVITDVISDLPNIPSCKSDWGDMGVNLINLIEIL